jgi:hypothetical protein
LQKKSPGGVPGLFIALWAFFISGKVWCRMWFFRGENVVECVVNVDKFLSLSADEKWDRGFNFIFWLGLGVISRCLWPGIFVPWWKVICHF